MDVLESKRALESGGFTPLLELSFLLVEKSMIGEGTIAGSELSYFFRDSLWSFGSSIFFKDS